MEENLAVIECIILFYINMKQVLKTKQVMEKMFIDRMIKHCKENGFTKYSGEEIKNTWKNLTSKYLQLKTKGTVEEKENWKYFDILDSCYEQSDFHNGFHSKFSEEMIWQLVECFLKRKSLKKTQKHDNIINEIHKEFLQNGYLYITKQDIENKWKSLNLKYEKFKNDPERLRKLPYLQAVAVFHEDREYVVNMTFTKELTEILIERFTEKKITCVIHGYDSDQVLNEIQSEFRDLGFHFSKDDIKEKWRTLTTIYKFIIVKGKRDTSWVYFDAMKKHFKNDFLLPFNRVDKKKYIEDDVKPRRLRERSKSVGADLNRSAIRADLEIQLNKISLDDLKLNQKQIYSSRRSVKRTSATRKRSKSRKKLKTEKKQKIKNSINQPTEQCKSVVNQESEVSNVQQNQDNTFSQRNLHLTKLPVDVSQKQQERRESTSLGSPTSKVHIINIDHSNIDQKNGNLTINLPSITKRFSDNEFLPLKKRLRIDGDTVGKYPEISNETNGFLGFPASENTEDTQKLTDTCENRRLTEEEMTEIMDRINRENTRNYEANQKQNSDKYTNYYDNEDNNYPNIYNNYAQSCLVVPKQEQPDSLSIQNYTNLNNMAQPPVVLVVIKVDGNNEPTKADTTLKDNDNKVRKEDSSEANKETENKVADLSDKQENEPSNDITSHSSGIVKVTSPKGKTIIRNKKDLVFSVEVCSDVNNSQIDGCNSKHLQENKQAAHSTSVNNQCKDGHTVNSNLCNMDQTLTYPAENSENKPKKKPEDPVFKQPLPAAINSSVTNVNNTDKHLFNVTESNTLLPKLLPQTSTEKVRLPIKGGGKLKEIFISPRELNKIAKVKPATAKVENSDLTKPSETNIPKTVYETNASSKKASPEFNGQVKSGLNENFSESKTTKKTFYNPNSDGFLNQPLKDEPLKANSKFPGLNNYTPRKSVCEEFESESVISEAVGYDDGLKDNLLATVIDFQEQNNQEFIEIKNLMKQNNLLQRETNRLLRLILEKH